MAIKIGDKWAGVECIGRIVEQVNEKWAGQYMAEFYVMRCKCGQEFKVRVSDQPRKMDWQDCGCGSAISTTVKAAVSLNLPVGVLTGAKEVAVQEFKGNLSAAVADMLQTALMVKNGTLKIVDAESLEEL